MAGTKIKTHYGCPGSCGGEVTEEQYEAGQKTCNDRSCECYGQQLEKMSYCSACDEYYSKDETQEHAECG